MTHIPDCHSQCQIHIRIQRLRSNLSNISTKEGPVQRRSTLTSFHPTDP